MSNVGEPSRRVQRPWGYFSSLKLENGHQVKEIVVNPGQRLSLQSHRRRSEHWVVVEGTALITVDDDSREYRQGAHIFIPLGARHRLANPGQRHLTVIEVQIGEYLGEDDIVRYEDDYQRNVASGLQE